VINVDAAFREQFFDISVRESVAEVPAHRHQDHVGREPENRQTTAKQHGDDESPAHATTRTKSVNATVPVGYTFEQRATLSTRLVQP
jgi:hypothetical protein